MAVSYWPEKFAKMVISNLQTQKYRLPLPNGFELQVIQSAQYFFGFKAQGIGNDMV